MVYWDGEFPSTILVEAIPEMIRGFLCVWRCKCEDRFSKHAQLAYEPDEFGLFLTILLV